LNNAALFTYLAVALYPIVMMLTPEPISFRWWLRNGHGRSMPPDVRRRSDKNEGYLLIAKFVILISSTVGLMRHTAVFPGSLGLRPVNLRNAILVGSVAGLTVSFWILSMRAAASRMPKSEDHLPFLLREPAWKILAIIVLGAFAEEYWRALSLFLLRRENASVGWALVITAIVFGIGHLLSP
jgi:membrane protease YdiL (CAAX protease family)